MNLKGVPYPLRARETFFCLLLAGYATGTEPENFARFEGDTSTKRNIWQDGKGWLGIDEWRTTPLGRGSNGTTSIYYNKVLVWEMQYGGFYPEHVIQFLRNALLENYKNQRWRGGRGPVKYRTGTLRYFNTTEDGLADFSQFSGREVVEELIDGSWEPVGGHYYRGGFLY